MEFSVLNIGFVNSKYRQISVKFIGISAENALNIGISAGLEIPIKPVYRPYLTDIYNTGGI